MEVNTITNFDPTSISSVRILGRGRYWLIGACTKRKRPIFDQHVYNYL
jgi:hypothetical protein